MAAANEQDKGVRATSASRVGGVKRWLIAASVTLNIAFIVVFFSILTSHSLDGLLMADGLERYCDPANDNKFSEESEQIKALREYVCNIPAAETYFNEGFYQYLDSKGIERPNDN